MLGVDVGPLMMMMMDVDVGRWCWTVDAGPLMMAAFARPVPDAPVRTG
jgi:hypothetical protein